MDSGAGSILFFGPDPVPRNKAGSDGWNGAVKTFRKKGGSGGSLENKGMNAQ